MSDHSYRAEIERDLSQLKHDFEAHHWLLAAAVVVAIFAAETLFAFRDLRGAARSSATITEKLIHDNDQLQQQLVAVRQELADLRQSIGAHTTAPSAQTNEPGAKQVDSAAPANTRDSQPKAKRR